MKIKERFQTIIQKIKSSTIPKTKQRTLLVLATSFVSILGIGIYFSALVRSLEKKKVSNNTLYATQTSPGLLSASSESESFCFAHISDAHVGERDLATKLVGAIDYFNDTVKPAFIIDTGDTVSDNNTPINFTNYTNIVKTSQSWQSGRFYAVPGNHDYIGGLINFNSFFSGKQVFDYQEYRFIGIDTMVVNAAYLSWIDQQLAQAASTGKKIILFGHYPVEYQHALYNLSPANREAIKSRMINYGVLAYLSGHLHFPELAVNPSPTVLDINAPSLGFTNSYQLICLKDGKISNYPLAIGAPVSQSAGGEITTVTLNQGIDSYLYAYAPQTNYCQTADLKVGEKQKKAALFKFDLSSIPAGTVVKSASLQVYVKGWSGNNITINAYKILNNWVCPGVNWGNFIKSGDRDPNAFARVTTQGILKWYELKLTSLAQEWINNPASNKGVLLGGSDPLNSNSVIISSFEASANKPKLIISYQEAGDFVPTPTLVVSATPAFTSTPTSTARPTSTPTLQPTPTQASIPTPTPISSTLSKCETPVSQGGKGGKCCGGNYGSCKLPRLASPWKTTNGVTERTDSLGCGFDKWCCSGCY